MFFRHVEVPAIHTKPNGVRERSLTLWAAHIEAIYIFKNQRLILSIKYIIMQTINFAGTWVMHLATHRKGTQGSTKIFRAMGP